jgi:Rrf2 family protein
MEGEAPRTTTKTIADSESVKSRIANGNQAMEGMLCKPGTSHPKARRVPRPGRPRQLLPRGPEAVPQSRPEESEKMWISKKTDYATRAVLALALARSDAALKMHEIAARTSVPESLLEQIMAQLRGAGIVRSERGPHGGYRLNHRPEEITLERVVRLFQGPLAPIACATRSEPEPCPMEIGCTLRDAWREVRDATIAILERRTFADLARRAGGPWLRHVPARAKGPRVR